MKKQILLLGSVALLGFAAIMLIAYWPESKTQQTSPIDKSTMEDLKGPNKGLRVLFVGNSHVFTNNVPDLVTQLSKAADVDRPLMTFAEAPGGTSFKMHWENGKVHTLLGEVKWDLVVLQDQSAMPLMSRNQRDQETVPFARKLNQSIKESGARTVLFMTWGYKQDYFHMQNLAREAYQELAADLKADLVPIGSAWEKAQQARPDLDLWMDGNHANMHGSYLAACVFYTAFYGKSPVGNSFTAGLDAADARFLQETATSVVNLQPGGLAAKAPGRAQ